MHYTTLVSYWSNCNEIKWFFFNAFISFSDVQGAMLKCYAGKNGSKYQECLKKDGFKTCFLKKENGNDMLYVVLLYKQMNIECLWFLKQSLGTNSTWTL